MGYLIKKMLRRLGKFASATGYYFYTRGYLYKSLTPLGFIVLVFFAGTARAQDVVNLSATIKGNQEHPSVSYIVPWQQAADEEKIMMPFNTRTRLMDVFNPVEREEHKRQLEFLTQMHKKSSKP